MATGGEQVKAGIPFAAYIVILTKPQTQVGHSWPTCHSKNDIGGSNT